MALRCAPKNGCRPMQPTTQALRFLAAVAASLPSRLRRLHLD